MDPPRVKRCPIKMRQRSFVFRTWGGKRKGAGRKPRAIAPGSDTRGDRR